jgi:hypothetical protein
MELALELLEVTSEAELDYFLGKVFKKIGRGLKKIARPLGGILKGIAKKALPFVGGALGSFIPIPGVGTAVGKALGTAASKLFEMELKGLSEEEQELEMARRFVRFAGAAAKGSAKAPRGTSPYAAARRGVATAAQRFAPGLKRRGSGISKRPGIPRRPGIPHRGPSIYAPVYGAGVSDVASVAQDPDFADGGASVTGRWIRRGPAIVILNCYGNAQMSPSPSFPTEGDEGDLNAQ